MAHNESKRLIGFKRPQRLAAYVKYDNTHIHAAVIFGVMLFVGLAGAIGIRAVTYGINTQAESGTITGNAARTGDTTASDGNSVVFGRGAAPTTPSGLKVFTGGTSIALRWSSSIASGDTIKQYNVFRNGLQVATITPGYHADFPEKDGNGYIDSNVTKGVTYSYQVQAVSGNNVSSALSASISATHPTSTTQVPTFTYNLNGATDLDDYMKNTVIPFLKIWYPKVADYIAYPNYTPYNTINLVLDANNANILDTHFDDGHITANTGFIRANYLTSPDHVLGAWLHEATHSIQGQATTAGNNGIGMATEGGADFSREFILHDRDPSKPTASQYYTDGYGPASYFLNWIQANYDANYVRKITVDGHNNAFGVQDLTFSNGKNIDELWAEMLGLPSHTGPFKSMANTSMCIDDQNAVMKSGNPMQVYTCNGSIQQKMTAQKHTDGTTSLYIIGYCLDVNNAGTADGTIVWLYNCSGSVAQQWQVKADGTIVNPNSGKCLGVITGSAGVSAGKGLGIFTCTGASWQKWTVPTGTPTS